ncbi:hypothetical protein [Alkalicoccus daliensis]|uniref:DUF3221 domain-containing protein n=1 Tax=Alkalicoccus daliensis TaxID=745820 RepID=A0A1H0DR72_9BACI|nr:hypothetical protein [Alkalicoccus daliensis]SDN72546.1 hypothetical protein SAMN04488053_10350 [Alkalicoccus daliensis]
MRNCFYCIFMLIVLSGCGYLSSSPMMPDREPEVKGIIKEVSVQYGGVEVEISEGIEDIDNVWLREHVEAEMYDSNKEQIPLEALRAGMEVEVWLVNEEIITTNPPQGGIDTLIVND